MHPHITDIAISIVLGEWTLRVKFVVGEWTLRVTHYPRHASKTSAGNEENNAGIVISVSKYPIDREISA
jgi:hypothetical protein